MIKSHHNGHTSADEVKLLEPLRFLFKDEVRPAQSWDSSTNGFIDTILGPGIGIRVLGELNYKPFKSSTIGSDFI